MEDIVLRKGHQEDCPEIARLLLELCQHEGHPYCVHEVDRLKEDGFCENGEPWFYTFVAEVTNEAGNRSLVGFVLYHYSYSMMHGRCAHMEALFVDVNYRKHGLGKRLIRAVAQVILDKNCSILEFGVLKKNTRGIQFYKNLGALNFTDSNGAQVFFLEKAELEKLLLS